MIISNWSLIKDEQGSLRIRGISFDREGGKDGHDITTSAIQFSSDGVVTTLSGSNYFLGAPASEAEREKLDIAEGFLPKRNTVPEKPFKGIIENWQTITINGNTMISGQSYLTANANDGDNISILGIKSKDGRAVITSSNSRYRLGSPHPDTEYDAKETLLSTLEDVNDAPLPARTVIGGFHKR